MMLSVNEQNLEQEKAIFNPVSYSFLDALTIAKTFWPIIESLVELGL